MKNTDIQPEMLESILKILVLENQCKVHMQHQIKTPQFYTDLGFEKQC